MPLVPRVEGPNDVDYLYHIISLFRLYFSCKYVRWFCNYCFFSSVYYICLLIYNLLCKSDAVIEQDVFYGAIVSELLMSKISLDVLAEPINKLIQIKTKTFWTHDLLSPILKRKYRNEMAIFVFLMLFLWLLALTVTTIAMTTNMFFPRIVFNADWAAFSKVIFNICYFFFVLFGYFIGNSCVSYYAYLVLHNYFQMKILMAFIRQSEGRRKKRSLQQAIFDSTYQLEIQEAFKQAIRQFQQLKLYGNILTLNYSRLTPYHVLAGTLVISIGVHSVLFSNPPNAWFIIMATVHLCYGSLLYMAIGQLFSETYPQLCEELQKLDWYTLDNKNQKLYYMFLMYSQRENSIEVLPSVQLSRPMVTKFVKLIYGGITVLRSTNIH